MGVLRRCFGCTSSNAFYDVTAENQKLCNKLKLFGFLYVKLCQFLLKTLFAVTPFVMLLQKLFFARN